MVHRQQPDIFVLFTVYRRTGRHDSEAIKVDTQLKHRPGGLVTNRIVISPHQITNRLTVSV